MIQAKPSRIPVMAKCRIGHFVEAQVLRVAWALTTSTSPRCSTPADEDHHVCQGRNFKVPFVCGCRDLGEALRRISVKAPP